MSLAAPPTPPAKRGALAKRVLIADDNHSKFKEVMETLQAGKVEVLHINDKHKLVRTAIDFQPDLIVCNLFLNGSSTLGAVRDIAKHLSRRSTKILVLTKHKSPENIQEAVKAGASDFVLEPFESRFLLQRIRYQLQDRESYSPEDLQAEPTQVLAGFQLVYECLRILTEFSDNQNAIFECLKRIGDLSQSTRVNVVMGNALTDEGLVLASSDDEKLRDLKVDLERYPEVREVLLNGSIVYIKDVTANPLTREAVEKAKDVKITSLLVFPIRHRGDTIGTLTVRLGDGGMEVSDKHLKTFFMVSLALASKVAAKRLMSQMSTHTKTAA